MFKLLFGTGTKSKLTRNEIEAKAAAGEELKSGDLRGVNLNKAKLSGARFETWFQDRKSVV